MKRGKPIILLLTVLFAAIAVAFGRNEIGMRNFPFSVMVTSDGVQEELHCTKIGGEYYLFLPSYAQGETAKICTNSVYDVSIAGVPLQKGQLCKDFPVNTKLDLHFRSAGKEDHETITFVRSANVATMYVDVPSGNMDYIHLEKGNSEPGWFRIYTETGILDTSGTLETIKGRGNATWVFDKKSYSLELSREADLLGLGTAVRWVLLSNSYDPGHVRNKLAFDMAKSVELPFSPDCTWTDLYLNGEYAGLYLLSERNEVHSNRVDIAADNSFLVSVEPVWRLAQQGYPYVRTDDRTALRIHHGTMPQEEIRQIWQSAENAIFAEDGQDPETGKQWDALIDMDSWVRKYLLEEVLVNTDACLASEFFFYEETDGAIHAGPVWDMDVILSDTDLLWLSDRSIMAGRPRLTDASDRHYFYELLQKQAFYDRVKELYQAEFRPLLVRLLEGGLEEYAQKTEQAALANQIRWRDRDPVENVVKMKEFIQNRMDFLDEYWIREAPFFLIQVQEPSRLWAFAVRPGETLEQLPDPENGKWYRADTDEMLDKTLPADSDLVIYAKENAPS